VSDWLRIVKKRHIAKAWRREDLRLPCHYDFCRAATFAACGLAGSIFVGACGMFKPTGEQVREQPSKTIYKAADETESERPNLTPAQKVPGE